MRFFPYPRTEKKYHSMIQLKKRRRFFDDEVECPFCCNNVFISGSLFLHETTLCEENTSFLSSSSLNITKLKCCTSQREKRRDEDDDDISIDV